MKIDLDKFLEWAGSQTDLPIKMVEDTVFVLGFYQGQSSGEKTQ